MEGRSWACHDTTNPSPTGAIDVNIWDSEPAVRSRQTGPGFTVFYAAQEYTHVVPGYQSWVTRLLPYMESAQNLVDTI